MSRITWDETGKRTYETGVDRGVLYVQKDGTYPKGVAWNGLTAVTDSPSGAEATPLYADNMKYLNLMSAEENGGTIEAYNYPDEFKACNGEAEIAKGVIAGQQTRALFGFAYRTILGNDTKSNKYGYKLHIVYNAFAAPSEKGFQTTSESPEPITMSWEYSTTPLPIDGYDPAATLTIDSTKTDPAKLKALEDLLYGTADKEASLPLPDEIIALVGASEEVAG